MPEEVIEGEAEVTASRAEALGESAPPPAEDIEPTTLAFLADRVAVVIDTISGGEFPADMVLEQIEPTLEGAGGEIPSQLWAFTIAAGGALSQAGAELPAIDTITDNAAVKDLAVALEAASNDPKIMRAVQGMASEGMAGEPAPGGPPAEGAPAAPPSDAELEQLV